jgi:hypothetical protein
MKGLGLDTAPSALGRALERWGLSWKALAVLPVLLYVTPIGGTRAGPDCFSPVAAKHVQALLALGIAGVDRAVW